MHSLAVKRELGSFGHETEPTKQQPPSEKPELHGVEVDLLEERMRLSKRKREAYSAAAERVGELRTCFIASLRPSEQEKWR